MDLDAAGHPARLTLMLKASWGVGGLGTTSLLYLINMFVVFFLVRHVGMPAAIAGSLLAATRLYDAVLNPVIGSLSDRTHGRWGRRQPWMLAGALLAPLGCMAVFNPPTWPLGTPLYAVVLGSLLLYCTAYSLFAIPHVALGSELTDDYRDRASLMAWRTFFVYASGIVITAGAPALVARLGGNRAAYAGMSYAAATVVGASMLWVVAFSGGRTQPVQRSSQPPLAPLKSLAMALSNRPFLMILLTKMTGQLGTAFSGSAMLFFITDVLRRNESALAVLGLVSNVVGVATVPLWNAVLRRVERRTLLMSLLGISALASLSWLLANPAEPQAVFILRSFILGACGSGSVLVVMAMLTDTLELDRLTTGLRREGLFVGAFELMQTTSFMAAPLIAGLAFSAAGLIPGFAGRGAQPDSALRMIRLAMSVVPAACSMSGILLSILYRLDAGKLAELRAHRQRKSGFPPDPSQRRKPGDALPHDRADAARIQCPGRQQGVRGVP